MTGAGRCTPGWRTAGPQLRPDGFAAQLERAPADDVLHQVRVQNHEPERTRTAGQAKGRTHIGVPPDDHHPGRKDNRWEQSEGAHRGGGVGPMSERPGGHAADVGLPQMLVQ